MKKTKCPKCGCEMYNLIELEKGGRFVICSACKYEGPRRRNNAEALKAYAEGKNEED